MICGPCVDLLAVVLAVVIGIVLLAFKPVRIAVIILILLALIGAAGLSLYVNEKARIGVALGGLLGVLLGPIRLAGVDFRQWFMDPSAPSEIGDDSFIALIRGGFHVLWMPALAAIVLILCMVSHWMPQACQLHTVPVALQPLSRLVDLVGSCVGAYAGVNFVLGTVVGVIAGPVMVELVWRSGLQRGLLPRSQDYLATQEPPLIRDKVVVANRRRLIICCDGTWNWPESKRETNVVRMVRALLPDDDGTPQIIHYHEGVGTGNLVDRIVGGGAGVGLSASVKACYGFLADNYNDGDEIFLFGFSRGAFVVRSLAGMIGAVGMMRKVEMARFAEVWSWYCLEKDVRREHMLDELAPHRDRTVDIECVGVWDTVGALGIPGTRFCARSFQFHDLALGTHIRHAFQALAIDERRGNFQGAVWVPHDPTKQPRGHARPQPQQREPDSTERRQRQVLRQMWFPGVHSNVGGGYPEHGLSDATFLWMVSQLQEFRLLGLDTGNIVSSLDNGGKAGPANNKEIYPGGTLDDSRTLFWKLIACPVPRPVAVISKTEKVHEIAWGRGDSALVRESDIYKTRSRRDWLHGIQTLRENRSGTEMTLADMPRMREPEPLDIRPKLGVCGHVLQFFEPQG
jgi:uncharacterized protein (DUF2235 family)